MLTQAKRLVMAGAIATLVVFAGWQLLGWGGPDATRVAGAVGSVAASSFGLAGAMFAAYAARGRQRATWFCLAAGLTGWVVADLYRACLTVAEPGRSPSASLVDLGYLLLPVGALTAAFFVPMARGRAGLRLLLDGVIVSMALCMIAWVLVLRRVSAHASNPQFSLALVSVVADTAMVTIAVMVMSKMPRGSRTAPVLLTVALTVIALTNGAYLYGYIHPFPIHVLLIGWATGTCLVGLAGLTSKRMPPLRVRSPQMRSHLSLWLPYAPMPVAVVLGAIDLWSRNSRTEYVLIPGVLLVLAAFVRQLTLLYENRRLLEVVAGLAMRDPLTGLANRALFSDRLKEAMDARRVSGGPVAVLLTDLDDFKYVNDSLGHPAGDAVLREVGDRIRLNVGPDDLVARIGGDEFAVLICDTPDVAALVAEKIVGAFDEPIVVDDRPAVHANQSRPGDGVRARGRRHVRRRDSAPRGPRDVLGEARPGRRGAGIRLHHAA